MAAHSITREVFATPRAAEFFQLRALQAQTGQPAHRFGAVLIKELLDNALDAAETARVPPEVSLTVTRAADLITITVADNGPGLSADLVEQILDFSVLVSDKAAYRSPTRGLQGNALKTVVGIPSALGCVEPVIIESQSVRHEIRAGIDPAGQLRIDHGKSEIPGRPGATIAVTIPGRGRELNALAWVRGFALVNPHATFTYLANSTDPQEPRIYKSTAPEGWHKPIPTDPTSAHHYDEEALLRLIFAHINKARRGDRDMPLGHFVRTFAGLSSTAKAKSVCVTLPHIRHLSDFEDHPEAVRVLLLAMQGQSRPPNHAALGRVDEDHYRRCFAAWFGLRRLWFKRVTSAEAGIPLIVEIALAETESPGIFFYGVNYSPTFNDPLAQLPLRRGEISSVGSANFLTQLDAAPTGQSLRAAAIHIISPTVAFLDKGKSTLVVMEGYG